MSHGLHSRVAVIGDLSQMYSSLLSLYFENLLDVTHTRQIQSGHRLSGVLLTQRIPHDISWQTWHRDYSQTRHGLEWLLPAMDSPSRILVIGHTASELPCARNRAMNLLQELIDGLGVDARNVHGKDVSVNGMELPPSASLHLTAGCLLLFLCKSPQVGDNNVICYENIEHHSIITALNTLEF